ncbi:DUF4153 domain-containing protein [Massilia sp. G4R7]|uniref:DUF4153 domain-containing protein n=1 Tax=Massilia phyllostachyos TaxID=2898585 RepID=A0ABS8Q8D8_9BURK|nr:DUF4153 domain-containing protein [Massilia phyllostachyos]MCD2517312.1 DUF4153 domain-containing protein [Massilia phyllostachyos]
MQSTADTVPQPGIAAIRIVIGLLQGLLLYLLYRAGTDLAWPATVPRLFVPLLLVAAIAPVVAISGIGQLTRRQLLVWTASVAAVVAALAFYDVWRMEGAWRLPEGPKPRAREPSPQLCLSLVAGFFIAHALVLAGAFEKRRIAGYTAYFETAWKLGVQLAFSGVFVGATWIVLHLGAALFVLIKLDFLRRAIGESWFAIPVTTFAFACAMHLTDLRPAIVQGIRNLLLVLLSWILPVLVLLVGGFLVSLPFTGLEPLWATRSAAGVLLSAAAAFVILINAAWQNGVPASARPVALAARIAALLLVPVVLLAIYALALRVNEYGWTDERVLAAACMLVAACYAGGYAAAAVRRGWLRGLAGVNIAAAFVVLGVLLALLTPLADPARLATNDQLARLASGRVTAAQFDVGYLHFDGARYGPEALARLEADAARPDASELRRRIAAVRKLQSKYQLDRIGAAPQLADNLRVWPAGARLPDSFLKMDWQLEANAPFMPDCLVRAKQQCDAMVIDLDGDAQAEVLLFGEDTAWSVAFAHAGERWRIVGTYSASLACPGWRQAMRDGAFRILPPLWKDLEVAGRRFPFQPHADAADGCKTGAAAKPDAAAP